MSKLTFRYFSLIALTCAIVVVAPAVSHGAIVFRDTFDRNSSATFGTNSGPEGSGTWTKTVTTVGAGAAGSFEINSNQALATHNAGDAIYQIGMPTSAFTSWPASNKFTDSAGKITWYINMQSTLTAPNGIGPNAGGMALALGATNSSFGAVGNNGYILYIGDGTTSDPIHLATFTGTGLGVTLSDVVVGTTAPYNAVGTSTNYYSYRVEFTPSTNNWELFGRDDGASAFADPTVGGGYVSIGTGMNATYTSTALPLMGLVGSWRNAGFVSRFDNFAVEIVPEPASVLLFGFGLAGMVATGRKRKIG